MSWASRFTDWSGKFSPFGRNTQSSQVSDADFSYITSEDLERHVKTEPNDANADILIVKHQKVHYPIKFQENTIDEGYLTIGVLRISVAKKLGVKDPRSIKLLYKGRYLKDDKRLARDEGFRSGQQSEILAVVGESPDGLMLDGEAQQQGAASEDEDEEDGDDMPSTSNQSSKKRRNRRGGKKKKRGPPSPAPDGMGSGLPLQSQRAEYLPTPSVSLPVPQTSRSQSRASSVSPLPKTPLEQLQLISDRFHHEYLPVCKEFERAPPKESSKRDFEHKRLTESILAQVVLKLDGVEVGGDQEARALRKSLVKESQDWLTKLDEMNKARAG